MNNNNQPSFWLQVRKEYVVENFESLLIYLRNYNYDASVETEESDFNKSYRCLQQVVDDLMADMQDDCLFSNATDKWGDKTGLNVRIIAAYLLASMKKNVDDPKVLCQLANLLELTGPVSTNEQLDQLYALAINCIEGKRVKSYGFSWNDIANKDTFVVNIFAVKFFATQFENVAKTNLTYYVENKGLLLVRGGRLLIAPMNYFDYRRSRLQSQLKLTDNSEVFVEEKDYSKKKTLQALQALGKNLVNTALSSKPSPVMRKKVYVPGDGLYVKLTSLDGPIVESIDPQYEKIKGRISLKTQLFGLDQNVLMTHLSLNDYLYVNYVGNTAVPFELDKSLLEFYVDEAKHAFGNKEDAVYIEPYSVGCRWRTASGLQVNIMGKTNEEIDEAIEKRTPIRVTIAETKVDRSGHYVVNGRYVTDDYPIDYLTTGDDFINKSYGTFIKHFLEWCTPDENYAEGESYALPLKTVPADFFTHLLFERSLNAPDTPKRFIDLIGAELLSIISGNERDQVFLSHELDYLSCLIHFATGDNQPLRLDHDSRLDGVGTAVSEEQVVGVLGGYVDTTVERTGELRQGMNSSLDIDYLRNLVDASNTLNGKIGISEINRIKKAMVEYLGVADVFCNIYRNITYYGEESDTLEFKSSLVYPSANNMQADLTSQKWAILKQLCGFLNTTHGGELLLGVNDNGYSSGLKNDLEWLYSHHYIAEQTMDKLRNYIKLEADKVFTDEQKLASGTEITATRLSYEIEKNDEGDSILRIQIHPYEYGIVMFRPEIDRPEQIADSYYRTSGATQPMNSELKRQVLEKKLLSTQDEDTRKFIQMRKAMKEHKIVVLSGYSSKSGTRDRHVEPYQMLPEHHSIVCYDMDKKEIGEFKVSRIDKVVITNQTWRYTNRHKKLHVDVFDMLEDQRNEPTHISLKLSNLASNLLREEHPSAEKFISKNTDGDQDAFPWILETDVYNLIGVGRFCIGLAKEIKIQEGGGLKDYMRDYMTQSLERLQA